MVNKKILIVDDEKNIVELIKMNLERDGFQGIPVYTGEDAITKAISLQPDLILLDLMLPDIDGLEVCRILKYNEETKDIPIIMITAKSEESDKVIGLGLGADDYITKPFGIRELEARIKTVLRRYKNTSILKEKPKKSTDTLMLKDLVIDISTYEVTKDGIEIDLTLTEFKILKVLMENHNRVMDRENLIKKVFGDEAKTDTRTIDVHILNIRKKLGDTKEPYQYIETIRGIGYRIK